LHTFKGQKVKKNKLFIASCWAFVSCPGADMYCVEGSKFLFEMSRSHEYKTVAKENYVEKV